MHEATLYHLISGLTSYSAGGEAFQRELIYEIFGQPLDGLESSDEVRRVSRSDQFRMIRRLLDNSLGCIVHSTHARTEVLRKDQKRPVACIPHGVEIIDVDTAGCRRELKLPPASMVVGVLGYQRPSKGGVRCLKIFRRLLRSVPDALLIVAGELHPEVPLEEEAAAMGIANRVHILPFQNNLAAFDRVIAACDVVLNLRSPAYGETSGAMMRTVGMGRP
ncbi:MAG TPA: glycosyltransferase [Bryobacteraceae bacterium]|nr:glycosyltransferase [Bryobacteraceae bacterium]